MGLTLLYFDKLRNLLQKNPFLVPCVPVSGMSTEKNKLETTTGVVIEALPNTMFKVDLEDGETLLTYLSGRMRRFRIRVLIGDKVQVELDPYGGKGRIIQRL